MPFALCVKTVVSYNISLDLNKFLAILFKCTRKVFLCAGQLHLKPYSDHWTFFPFVRSGFLLEACTMVFRKTDKAIQARI